MNDTWMASPAVLPASASHLAARTPACQAWVAAWSTRRASRCSAPEALTVRIAPRTRSRAVPMVPTDSWAREAAREMRGTTTPVTTWAPPSTTTVTASSSGSSRAITVMVASSIRVLVTADTSDPVVTSRSRVVSAVTRAMRSPGSLRSTAGMRSHTRWETRRRRASRTTDSAVRSSR